MSYLESLNPAQRRAVTAGLGPVLILAGPGSGKTRVLVNRIAYLVDEMGVRPWNILAVTFTNKAAREMRSRVESVLGNRLDGITLGTFHSACVRILRREADNLDGYDRDFVIFDTDDQKQVVKQALKDLNLDEKRFKPTRMLGGIGDAKNNLITPETYAATNYIAEVTKRVYTRYQDLLLANNAMDFDDLLLNTVALFDRRPDVLERYQARYQHILVDEFQDTNAAQYGIVRRLAGTQRNIFVVGDSDQSIYRWRGADFRNIMRFREHFPDAQQILLEQNYRSTQLILDAAKSVIRRNRERVDKNLFTDRLGGARLTLREAYNETEEAQMVVDTIAALTLEGYEPGDFAVMYRTNAQSRVLEEAFVRHGLPYRLVGATRFYGRREIKDLIAYLRVIHNPRDSISYNRIINTPSRKIGAKTQQKLRDWALEAGLQPAEALMMLAVDKSLKPPFGGRALSALTRFGHLLYGWNQMAATLPVGELLDRILDDIAFRDYLEDGTDEGRDRWANVLELKAVAGEDETASLGEFLEAVALVADVDNLEEGVNAPTLLTFHAAKGLEFRVVYLTGLEEGVLPHLRSLDDGEEMAEERRLFYVGLTRAQDRVYLSYAFRRSMYGTSEAAAPSRFLSDIPSDLLEGTAALSRPERAQRQSAWQWPSSTADSRRGRERSGSSWSTTGRQSTEHRPTRRRQPQTQAPDAAAEPARPTQFKSGDRVVHAAFGAGIVLKSTATGNDEEVTVHFAGGIGIKKLAASFANLKPAT